MFNAVTEISGFHFEAFFSPVTTSRNEGDEHFEELDDDFVTQVLEEPKEADFDYDAHIANLIMKSERQLGGDNIRGWDDEIDDDMEEFSLYDDGYNHDNKSHTSAVSRTSTYAEEKFEKLLDEYDDEELGDAPFASEAEVQGIIDDTTIEGDLEKVFDQALNDYLKEKQDESLATGVLVKKGTKVTPLQAHDDAEFERRFNEESMPKHEKYRILAQEANKINEEYVQPPEERNEEILHCQEYLRDVRVEEKWDCETILSTYSTLENHPTVIDDNLKPQKKENTDGSVASGASRLLNNSKPNKIVLSGKFNMPIEYVAGYKGSKKHNTTNAASSVVSSSSTTNQGGVYSRNRNKLVDLVKTHVMEKGLNKMAI